MVWLFLFLFSLMLFMYPYVLYPLCLKFMSSAPIINTKEKDHNFSVGLIFCAHNEEAVIDQKIQNIRDIKAILPDMKFAAYSDGSTDQTLTKLMNHNDIVTVHYKTENLGKATVQPLIYVSV